MFGYPRNVWYQLVLFVQERRSLENSWGTWSFSPISIGQWAATIPRNVASWPRTLRACLGFVTAKLPRFWMFLVWYWGRMEPVSLQEGKTRLHHLFSQIHFLCFFFLLGQLNFLDLSFISLFSILFQNGINPINPLASKGTLLLWFFNLPICPKDLDLNFQDLEYPSLDLAEAPGLIREKRRASSLVGCTVQPIAPGASAVRWRGEHRAALCVLGQGWVFRLEGGAGVSMELASNSGNYVLKVGYNNYMDINCCS